MKTKNTKEKIINHRGTRMIEGWRRLINADYKL